jgi:LIVCS family branched-chain amino acid:cation transporter
LTPLKLGTLVFLIFKGFIYPPEMPVSAHTDMAVFLKGLKEGYQTMDLLGCFFFCSVVLDCLRKNINVADPANYRKVIAVTLKASCIGAGILAAIYVGFSYVAAYYSGALANATPDQLIGLIAVEVLGPHAGIFVGFTVTLACMTTAIALSTVFAEFIHKDLTNNKISYPISLIITLVLTYFISIMHFTGISQFLAPILQLCYPALIVLSIVNILYKLYEFKPVKVPVLIMFALSLYGYFA